MNILITGATGFLGKQLTLKLLSEGHSVYALARNKRKGEKLKQEVPPHSQRNLTIIEGNLSERHAGISNEQLQLLQGEIDTVYHSAAYLSFDDEERDKTFRINVEGTQHMIELAEEIQAPNFFYVSTAYTLGTKLHATETLHSKNQSFVNAYEESKCHAEHLVLRYKNNFHIKIFRPSIIIGDSKTGEADTNFALYGIIRGLEILKKRIARNKELQHRTYKFLCTGDTSQNFVPVDYVVDVLTTALKTDDTNTIYHITNPNPPTNRLLFEMVKEKLDFPNIEMVSSDYDGVLTKEEQMFNAPLSVFRPYWSKNISFDDKNTQKLLRKNGLDHLHMDKAMVERILYGNRDKVEV